MRGFLLSHSLRCIHLRLVESVAFRPEAGQCGVVEQCNKAEQCDAGGGMWQTRAPDRQEEGTGGSYCPSSHYAQWPRTPTPPSHLHICTGNCTEIMKSLWIFLCGLSLSLSPSLPLLQGWNWSPHTPYPKHALYTLESMVGYSEN